MFVGILFRFGHKISHAPDPGSLGPKGPRDHLSNPTSSRSHKRKQPWRVVFCARGPYGRNL